MMLGLTHSPATPAALGVASGTWQAARGDKELLTPKLPIKPQIFSIFIMFHLKYLINAS